MLQAGLRLEPQQATELVSARHVLMRKVLDIRQARGQIVLALGASAVDPDAVRLLLVQCQYKLLWHLCLHYYCVRMCTLLAQACACVEQPHD